MGGMLVIIKVLHINWSREFFVQSLERKAQSYGWERAIGVWIE